MSLSIPEGFKPTYSTLVELADMIAGDSFIVKPKGAPEFTPDERLVMLMSSLAEQKQWARNVLEGKPVWERRED